MLAAPAKLNLGLRVVGRRPDGYHLLESLFVPIDLADDLTLRLAAPGPGSAPGSAEVEIVVSGDSTHGTGPDSPVEASGARPHPDPALGVPADDRNLAVRAARAFLEHAAIDAHVHIDLHKRIPAGAGLGGGSSDAGAVLRGLRDAWPGALDPGAVEAIAVGLGADVPFFLDPRPSIVTGIGERRRPLADVPSLALVLASPHEAVATAEVFRRRAENDAGFTPEGELEACIEAVRRAGWLDPAAGPAWVALLQNDLQEAAEAVCPAMRGLRDGLEAAGALASGQSGSGATVFGVFANRAAAEAARESLSANDSAWFRVAISRAAR